MVISAEEAADRLDELVDRALDGERIVLTVEGRPAAVLEAVRDAKDVDGV